MIDFCSPNLRAPKHDSVDEETPSFLPRQCHLPLHLRRALCSVGHSAFSGDKHTVHDVADVFLFGGFDERLARGRRKAHDLGSRYVNHVQSGSIVCCLVLSSLAV